MDPEDKEYVCSLDEESLKIAKEELFEDPKDRLSSVQTFRAWILQQKHFTCRTDTPYLLKYLRGAKFSQLRARELVENTLSVMTDIPKWFRNIDTHEPGVQEYMKRGVALMLPKRDAQNRRILMIRPGAIKVKNEHYSLDNEMRQAYCVSSFIGREELTHVYGYVLIFDFSGYTMKHMSTWTRESSKKQMRVWQDCTPGRVKAFHFYNPGTFFEMMMAVSRSFMKKKTQERMHVHDTMESLYKYVPKECLPLDFLPDDYQGDNAGSLENIIATSRRNMMEESYRQEILNTTKPETGIDMKLKRKDIPQESFRKMQID